MILDSTLVPSVAHFERWGAQLAAHGFARMRTGALAPRQALQAEGAGLTCIQELVLLEARPPFDDPHRAPPDRASTSRDAWASSRLSITPRSATPWQLDPAMLARRANCDAGRTCSARQHVVSAPFSPSRGRAVSRRHRQVASPASSSRAGPDATATSNASPSHPTPAASRGGDVAARRCDGVAPPPEGRAGLRQHTRRERASARALSRPRASSTSRSGCASSRARRTR